MTPSINIFDECGLNNEVCNYYKQNPCTVVLTIHFTVRRLFTNCTLLTTWSASVIKFGMSCG